ncbi:sialate O-acetylesterase [Coraliomargarita sp. SDUM461003]|uniref:Sialate O-acetylesterase n=1 Tax=Thalassobacterium maritimum TaxID=3041265 RepID=A0ABU1APX6_9BACT|nr:sialate O-acetylesterase [Coraliomargarita sp. SDUM461003]MDQ8206232.1 sialate O-acetylesterase [Coraliomargarita sp. SDUM461003]
MNTIKILLISTLFAAASAAGMTFKFAPEPRYAEVFIRLGQSNEVGRSPGTIYKASTLLGRSNDPYIRINSSSGGWLKPASADLEEGNSVLTDGWESLLAYEQRSSYYYSGLQGFARELAVNQGMRDVHIIQYARNASRLNRDWREVDDLLYPDCIAFINTAISDLTAAGWVVRVNAISWVQGNGDAFDPLYGSADLYGANLTQLLADLRSDITGASAAPVLVVRSPDFWRLPFEPGAVDANSARIDEIETVQAAQAAVVSADLIGATLTTTTSFEDYIENWDDEVSGGPYPTHYDEDSKQQIGILQAQSYMSL